MWYTVLHDRVPVGVVELPAVGFAAGALSRLPGYAVVRPVVPAATAALLERGLFAAAERLSVQSADALRWRRALARAARLELELLGEHGDQAPASFVNLLEAPGDGGVVVVAGLGESPALVGAAVVRRPGPGRGG